MSDGYGPGLWDQNGNIVGYVPSDGYAMETLGTVSIMNSFSIGVSSGPLSTIFTGTVYVTIQMAPNNGTQNPCANGGRAMPPSAYAQTGKAANGNTLTFLLNIPGWQRGSYFDAQPMASGTVAQNAAYGNYVFGVYMQSAGVSLSTALSGANAYAFLRSSYPAGTPMDPNYPSLPAANVANITNGYNAQAAGTTCHF